MTEPATEQRCGVAVRRNGTGRPTEETVGGAEAGGSTEPPPLAEQSVQGKTGNHRNGSRAETVVKPGGGCPLDIARDRLSTFEPALIAKYPRRLPGFDDHVIRMYAREIRGHLLELYGLEVSPDLISTLTDEVLAEVEQWQTRPLEAMYPIVS